LNDKIAVDKKPLNNKIDEIKNIFEEHKIEIPLIIIKMLMK
jgi:hypothetical protein